ncbi:MAG: ribulose-phosphate 3-epimerase [Candidatus Methylomirabilales bacterium]|nr:ribulose-phosphate 3-epimerase [candidate division NC10 bacterium]MCH7896428.1 ribulose-phosphate 3-epimerase [candidate division NC10 bacterium]MCZ6550043.1 ribulose-phosphate 3-epimerase [candidate division NC10 bacterium]
MVKIAPAVLMVDYGRLADEIVAVEKEADLFHFDVMDGHFVPVISYGASVIRSLRPRTAVPFDVHLMVQYPERYITDFAKAGSDRLTVHAEVCPHLDRTIRQIKEAGAKAGVALNPSTPLEAVDPVIRDVDTILLMSVNPGFGGQGFIAEVEQKVERLRQRLDALQIDCELEVDGGIKVENASRIAKAGASILVAGSAVFQSPDPVAVIRQMKHLANP